MTGEASGQELVIQLETALHRLVESFWEEPYRCFTEADAHIGLQAWVARRPELMQVVRTKDGFETGLLHREYPTFFRLKDSDPTERLPSPARRGHYDLVLIDPDYIAGWRAQTVTNRVIKNHGSSPWPPLLAAVEFKLGPWRDDTGHEVWKDLGKLQLALREPPDVSAAYLCVLQRDTRPVLGTEKAAQAAVAEMLAGFPGICAVVAIAWPKQDREPFVHYHGPWITTAT